MGPNGNGVGNSPNIEPGSTTPPLAPGTKADSEGDLKAKFGDEILCQKHLPDSGAQSVKSVALRGVTLCLTATPTAVGAQKTLRVWLHNKASQNAKVPAGALIGQGGQGTFVSVVTQNIEDDKKDFAWRYTRITGFKKDNAELANGFMIFNKTGTPLEGHPKLVLLHEVERELGNNFVLYGHAITRGGSKVSITPSPTPVVWLPNAPAIGGEGSGLGVEKFEAATLGQFLRSHECTVTVPKCKGLVRPVFEMKASQQTQGAYALMPSPPRAECFVVVHDEEK